MYSGHKSQQPVTLNFVETLNLTMNAAASAAGGSFTG